MSKRMLFVALGVLIFVLAPMCLGETYKIGDYGRLKDMLENRAEPGDVIEVQPGVMYAESEWIYAGRSGTPEKPIIVRGVIENGQRPVIDGSRVATRHGLFFFPPETHDIIVENLELRHARGNRHLYSGRVEELVYNHNAGMFFEGDNITVRNCYSHHNEDGFFASREADYILIENCEIGYNGLTKAGRHAATHNFYFCARHQMVKNCYLHDPRDGENFKSRGGNTIFAFNWVDEDWAYSIEQCSAGGLNTLWLGNVVAKRSTEGLSQGRVIAVGDGTGVVSGTIVAANNTFVSFFPRDYFLFSFPTSLADVVLINNVFAGPAKIFARHNGQGTVTGSNNWMREGILEVPEGLENTIYGEDPGFESLDDLRLRLTSGSPLIDAGVTEEKYAEAMEVVLASATSGTDATPSPPYLEALEDITAALPKYEPIRKDHGFNERVDVGPLDVGAYEHTGDSE